MFDDHELSKGMQKVNLLSLILISIKIDKHSKLNFDFNQNALEQLIAH